MEVLTQQEAVQQTTAQLPAAPPRLDELAFGTLVRAIDAGLYGGELRLLLWLLELDCSERAEHRGAFAWFNAYAKTAAESLGSVPHRIRERMRNLKGHGWIYFIHGKGEFRTWIRHNNEPPPPPDAPIPQPDDPQQRFWPAGDARTVLDSHHDASIDFPVPGDGPVDRPGHGQESRPEDAPELRPGLAPEADGAAVHGSEPGSYGPPPPLTEGGERPSRSAHQLGAHQLGAHQLGAHQLGAHQLGAHRVLTSRREVQERKKEEDLLLSSSREAHQHGAHQVGALNAIAAALASIDPAELPWADICPHVARTAARLRTPGKDRLGREPRDLVVSAATIAVVIDHRDLGVRWLEWAADRAPKASSSRRDYFFGILARGLVTAGLAEHGQRCTAMDQLQRACGAIVDWFDRHVDPKQELTGAPAKQPAPKPEAAKPAPPLTDPLLIALAETIGHERFGTWFGAGTSIELTGQVLTITAPNQFFMHWIRTNFRKSIEDACVRVTGVHASLQFQTQTPKEEK